MQASASTPSEQKVVIVGGGLAGIAAATALVKSGLPVTLLESRPQLGGRATSYVDRESGETIDNCQHVSMGCCTNLRHLCQLLGLQDAFQTERELYFISPGGQTTPFAADPLPAPFHLTRAFLRLPYLSFREKRLFATAIKHLAKSQPAQLAGQNFADWLRTHHQTDSLIQNVWDVVLVSALSESLERIDAAYARKVFVDGFVANSAGWQVEIPRVDLDELYSKRTRNELVRLGVDVRTKSRVHEIRLANSSTAGETSAEIHLVGGEVCFADQLVLAVPQHQVAALLPPVVALQSLRSQVEQIQTAPITSVHLWYDRPLTTLPHAVLLARLGQWLFNRGLRMIHGQPAYYYQVVISASRQLKDRSQADVICDLDQELQAIWPSNPELQLIHSRMITERRAVFSVIPGIDAFRPDQQTSVPCLQLAGDWTRTGWPATMEGAVISGFRAAENILRYSGKTTGFVQPALPVAKLSRWIFGLRDEKHSI